MNAPQLVLITTNHPYTYTGGEVMFVGPELERLAPTLGTMRIAPQHVEGEEVELPAGVELDRGLARALSRARLSLYLRALAWPGLWAEFRRAARHGGWIGCVRVWRWAAIAQVTYRWARKAFAADTPVLFYTYWRGGSTLALARLAAERPATAVMTRVHGYELYEERFRPPFQPWHPVLYRDLALTATVSQHGYDYLRAAGVAPERLMLARLGTEPASQPARASADGVLRIVSCSTVTPVKRVPLIAEAVLALARHAPEHRIHWTHFGDGPGLDAVRARVEQGAPTNFTCELTGTVAHSAVLAHYAHEPVDAFLLLSESEGLPVSIQEAAGAGIPVLATDVGGVRELVGGDNGALLPANPTVREVADALEQRLIDSDAGARAAMRAASRRRWAEGFDAGTNQDWFARRVKALLHTLR